MILDRLPGLILLRLPWIIGIGGIILIGIAIYPDSPYFGKIDSVVAGLLFLFVGYALAKSR